MQTPQRTQYGKWVIYRTSDGERLERWPVDASGMLETDEFTAEPPEQSEGPEAEPEPEGAEGGDEPRIVGIEAERASRLRERWDKNTPPKEYIERYGEETEAGQLARQILDLEAAAEKAERPTIGEAGPAEPATIPRSGPGG